MKKYIDPILRWWWLILLSTLIAGVVCYYSVRQLPPVYEVHATLIVGKSFNSPNPSSADLYTEQQLASVYAALGTSSEIYGPTMQILGLSALPEYFVRLVPNTSILDIVVSDTDPHRAQAVANELANQMIKGSPSSRTPEDAARQPFISSQLDKLQTDILDTENKIVEQNQKLAEANNARQIADIQALINALEQKRISLQSNYSALLLNTDQGAVNNLSILQKAPLPSRPVGPNKTLYIALAAAFGMLISTAAAYLIQLTDNRVTSENEIMQMLNVPLIGEIPNLPQQDRGLFTILNPRSPITDDFRSLRTNIEFMGIDKPIKTLLITSPDRSNGKSTVASNLALTFAQAEKKVVLLDADLRRPCLHSLLNMKAEPGLSDACLGRVKLENVLSTLGSASFGDGDEKKNIVPPGNFLFKFLAAGTLPPNPAELLASARFDEILASLSQQADLIIIDCPPMFLPDTAMLLPKVDGVLLVFQQYQTYRRDLTAMKEQIQRSGAHVLGVVLNRTSSHGRRYHNYGYAAQAGTKEEKSTRKPLLRLKTPRLIPLKKRK